METKVPLHTQEIPPAASHPGAAFSDEQALAARLVERGLVTEDQLRDALEQQQTLAELGERRGLAEVLIALGYVTPEQLCATLPAEVPASGELRQKAQQARLSGPGLADRLAEWLRKAIKRPA